MQIEYSIKAVKKVSDKISIKEITSTSEGSHSTAEKDASKFKQSRVLIVDSPPRKKEEKVNRQSVTKKHKSIKQVNVIKEHEDQSECSQS